MSNIPPLFILDFQLRIRKNPRTFLWREHLKSNNPTLMHLFPYKKPTAKLPDLIVLG